MKIILNTILMACVMIGVNMFGLKKAAAEETLTVKPEGKVLVVYYSQSKNKNTGTIAKWIHEALGGDIYEIERAEPYSDSYREVLKESKAENESGINPKIKPFDKNVADYDIVFIGSPIWYGTYAPPVKTFLADNNLQGKTVVPFCTHGGGGASHFYEDVAKNAKGSPKVLEGFTAKGSNIVERTIGWGTKNKVSQDDVVTWLNKIFK